MKTKSSFKNLVTLLLFASFLLTYFLDLTGLNLHQWLGIIAAAAAVLHLLMHWKWVKAVTSRFFRHTSGQTRFYYLLNLLLFAGLALITLTGLVISSWFNLSIASYDSWRLIHVAASLLSIIALVLKLAIHWKYIAAMIKPSHVLASIDTRSLTSSTQNTNPKLVSRREALRVIGTVAVVGLVGIIKSASALRAVEAATLPQPLLNTQKLQGSNSAALIQSSVATPTASAQSAITVQPTPTSSSFSQTSQPTESCVVRCDKRCSYPGRCRRYTDANNNQRCDLGECLAV